MKHIKQSNEYATRGEYHKYLDPNWSYYPIYVRKMAYINDYMANVDNRAKILDAGCGEGVLVEKHQGMGKNIIGLDLNISNRYVKQGDILKMPFEKEEFDLILFLDVIEHLNIPDQPVALNEIYRVLKNKGKLIISIPNLAHKASRWKFFRTGKFKRTANVYKHPGDRPIKEYVKLIKDSGFVIERRVPIKLTLPSYMEKILKKILPSVVYENYIYSPKRNPDDCFLNIFVLQKVQHEIAGQ